MINHIKLKNFKAFQEAEIPLTALNLFTGINGIGKSSFIQTLLLLRQSHLERQLPERFILNHEQYVQLGKSQDIFNMYAAEKENLSIQLQTDLIPNLYIEVKPEQDKTFLNIAHYSPSKWTSVEKEPLFNQRFQYLYAERESPKKYFTVDQYAVEQLRSLGNKGQHTAHFIAKYQTETVKLPSLIDAQAVNDSLGSQIDAWLAKITKGVRLVTQLHSDLDIARLSYQFFYQSNLMVDDLTPEFSPMNVGFGFTYVLPVITALLSARPGDLIIIENPESHLHPSGQARIGQMLALAAQDGVQLIVETHSDHVLNGIRVAAKHFHSPDHTGRDKGIDCNKINILFFERLITEHSTRIIPIKVDKRGRLSRWPKSFFDEWDKMLDELMD